MPPRFLADPIVIRDQDLVLREWRAADVPPMVTLFDTAEMDRWTPLASPFDFAAATAYVERAHRLRAEGCLQLAITEGADEPLGEVLAFPTDVEHTVELAYAVGAQHRGRNLAVRAVLAVLAFARAAGYAGARLLIAADNVGSRRVATRTGFVLTHAPLVERSRKGRVVRLETWTRELGD